MLRVESVVRLRPGMEMLPDLKTLHPPRDRDSGPLLP